MKIIKNISTLFALLLIPFVAAHALNGPVVTPPNEDVRTIEMDGTDQMKFTRTQITAKPGEKIRIVLTTVSKLPKAAMAHNFVLMQKDIDLENFANKSVMARDNGYIAPELKDQVIAATDLAGGGETVEVTFTVPEEKGNYTYLCSFPGHFLGGMKGTLTVQ
jgi:azurin